MAVQEPIFIRKKIKMLRKKTEDVSILGHLWDIAFGFLKSAGTFEERAEKTLEKYKTSFQKWMVKVAVIGLSIFMSLAFLTLGLFFVAIDYFGVPRGVVFICGGLLVLLVLKWMVPSTIKKRED